MAYTSWSVVFGEQPSAAKWNLLGANDASFNDGTGIADGAIVPAHLTAGTGTTWPFVTWSPTLVGFSANPSSALYYYKQVGKAVTLFIYQPNDGTSNGATFTISLPVTARTIAGMAWAQLVQCINNGTGVNDSRVSVASGATVLDVFRDENNTAWTTSNAKRIRHPVQVTYEAA